MKKTMRFSLAVLLALCALCACSVKDPAINGGNNNGNDDNGNGGGSEVLELDINIDGDFADWDALTEKNADETAVIAAPGNLKSVKVMKATSDVDNLYVYAEISVDKIQHSETAHENGNSNDGHGATTPGPTYLYIDADADADTGFNPHINSGITGLGLEYGIEIYLFINVKDGTKVGMGWSQVVVAPQKDADGNAYDCAGDFYQQGDWWSLKDPAGGWNTDYDNICPPFDLFEGRVSGAIAKIEFAIPRNKLPRQAFGKEISFAIAHANGSDKADWGNFSGNTQVVTLKVNN